MVFKNRNIARDNMHTFSRMSPLFILAGLKAFLRFLQYEVLSTFRRDMSYILKTVSYR